MAQITPPPGFVLDALPEGFVVDKQREPSNLERLTTAMGSGYQKAGAPGAFLGGVATGGKILDEGLHDFSYKSGGAMTDLASEYGASPRVAAGIGAATKTGIELVPDLVGGKAIGTLAKPAMMDLGRGLMQSAVKPNQVARMSGQADRAIETMLEKGIDATGAGLKASQSTVNAMESAMQKILDLSPATVNKGKVAASLRPVFDKFKYDPNRIESEKEVMKALDDFMNQPEIVALGNDIPVALANKMKQAFTKIITDKAFVPGVPIPAYDKGIKGIASGLRKEVGINEPAIAPTLAEQAELMNVLKTLKPRVSVEGNKNPLGLGLITPSLERTMAWMLERSPWFKSWLAHTAYTGAERIPTAVGTAGIAAGEEVARRKENGR